MTVDAVRAGLRVAEVELELDHRATGRTWRVRPSRPPARGLRPRIPVRAGPRRLASAPRDPRHRPGHHRHDLHGLRRGRRSSPGARYREFEQHFPRPGWVEHDAAEIWDVTQAVAGEALDDAGVGAGELRGDRHHQPARDRVAWDRRTGEPLHRALVWQDRRTAARCDELREQGHEALVRERTGLVIDPYFCGTKIEWLLRNVDGLERARREGRAMFGTIDSWLDLQADRGGADRALQRLAHVAVRHPRGWSGTRSCVTCWGCRPRAARGSALGRGVTATAVAARVRGAGRRHRGRPAGGAVRAGVPGPGPRQEHVRDRLVRAAQLR